MTVYINNEAVRLPSENMTVAELLTWRHKDRGGTAVAVNDKIVKRAQQEMTYLKEDDKITLISATFGG